jgi:hypothetical protein
MNKDASLAHQKKIENEGVFPSSWIGFVSTSGVA